MKRNLLILCLITLSLTAYSREWQPVEHTDILTVQFGGLYQNDEYLSPFLYTGLNGSLRNEWWQPFRKREHWLHSGMVEVDFAKTYHPRKTNVQYQLMLSTSWGAFYDFTLLKNAKYKVDIFLGPQAAFNFAARYHLTNVNKPVSLDLGAYLQPMAGVSADFYARRTAYRLSYQVATDIIGVMFAPEYWQAYYEMTSTLRPNILFASWHNHRSLYQQLTLDMQFKHSCWRIGVRHTYSHSTPNNLTFSTETISAVLGTIFNYSLHTKPIQ